MGEHHRTEKKMGFCIKIENYTSAVAQLSQKIMKWKNNIQSRESRFKEWMEGKRKGRKRERNEDDEECWLVYELKFQQQIAMYTVL